MMRIHHIPASVTLLMAAVVFSAPLLTNLVLALAAPAKPALHSAVASNADLAKLQRP